MLSRRSVFAFSLLSYHSRSERIICFVQSGATCIFHTAAPAVVANPPPALYHKVNVIGTTTALAAAAAHRVPKFVYTSSAGNVYNGNDLIDCDERMPVPPDQKDEYNVSKAKAEELVLAANGQDGLHTVALRPAGIFGCVFE